MAWCIVMGGVTTVQDGEDRPSDGDSDDQVDPDRMFRILRRPPCRRLLRELYHQEVDGPGRVQRRLMRERETSFVIEMKAKHLPMLEDAGLIEWNATTLRVQRGPEFGDVIPFLALIDRFEDE